MVWSPRNRIGLGLAAALLCLAVSVRAEDNATPPRDTLVYKDGDRVQGRVVGQADGVIVFQSERFGELRVPATEAEVVPAARPPSGATDAGPPPAAVAAAGPGKPAAPTVAENEALWEHFTPAALAAQLSRMFGPWHGRLASSAEVVSDTADRKNLSFEAQLRRKWPADEVQLNGRYDYSETTSLTTGDMVKGDGQWRHDFNPKTFAQYRPSLEWNRANFVNGVPADYVLLQQEIGLGVSLLTTPARKVRMGVSENLFDNWQTSLGDAHTTKAVESTFLETELHLPWGMLLTERGAYYFSVHQPGDGWENRVELTKKFTETLSTAIRHETRQGSPDSRAQDYTRLNLLLGLDF